MSREPVPTKDPNLPRYERGWRGFWKDFWNGQKSGVPSLRTSEAHVKWVTRFVVLVAVAGCIALGLLIALHG